jgi:hypothetical protein
MTRLLRRAALFAGLTLAARWSTGPAADIAVYPLLGVLPGLALADMLLPAASRFARVSLALALAPLVVATSGWLLVSAGLELPLAGWAIAGTAGLLWVASGARKTSPTDAAATAEETEVPRLAWGLALGLGLIVLVPPMLNPYIAVRGDTWTHAGIVMRILERGLPPEDPRFAAIPLHYVWFYNLFIALLSGLRGGGPFSFMTCLNGATAFATVGLTTLLALRVWRTSEAGKGAALLAVFGLNAGAFLLWPLRLVLALTGEVRNLDEVARQFRTTHVGEAWVIHTLAAPFAHMVSLLDKLMVGSPLGYGYLLMILHLWAMARWLERGRVLDLVWLAAAAAGMMLFHGVVGLSVIPVWLGTLGLALLLSSRAPWRGGRGRLAAAFAATLAGGLAATPYMISVASGWAPGTSGLRHSYIAPDPLMPWTLVTAGAFALWFAARPALRSWGEGATLRALIGLYLLAMIVFGCLVRLPEENQVKFVYQAFVPAVILAAAGFQAWLAPRLRRPATAALLAVVFLVPPAVTLHGYILDPARDPDANVVEPAGEPAFHRWIREHTPVEAIIVDSRFRNVVMVKGRRPLYLGTSSGPERAAFPMDQVVERRRVTADLYGPAAAIEDDLIALERLGRPIYVVYRPEDDAETAGAWGRLDARRDRFELSYDHEGYRVLRLIPRRGDE